MQSDSKRESVRRAQKKYFGKCRTYIIRLRQDNDADVIERIDSMPSKIGYIRDLVRADIRRQRARERRALNQSKANEQTE